MSTTNIREFMKQKESRNQKETDYMDRIRSHRRSVFYRFLVVAFVIAIVGIIISIRYNTHIYTTYEVINATEKTSVDSTVDVGLGNSVLSYSKDGAYCMDAKGSIKWNETYEMQNPILDICQGVAAIGEYNGSKIYVVNESSILGEISTELPIKNICAAANGVVAAVLEDADTTWIYVYDKDGNELVHFRTRMVQTGYPVAMSLSPNAKLMAVSYLYVDVGVMKSSVAFYNFDSVGQSQTDRYMSGYDYDDTVVPFVRFINNDTAVAIADNRMMVYKGSQKPESSVENLLSEEVQAIYYDDKHVGLIYYNDSSEEKNLLEIYNENGSKIATKKFNMEYTGFFFEQDRYVIYSPSECLVCSINGTEKYEGVFEHTITTMIPLGGSYKYTLVSENKLESIQLK